MTDYNIRLIRFPSCKVHEAVTMNEDGTATIFLDKNETRELQIRRFKHVMRHLDGDDFDKYDAQEIESETHNSDEKKT